MGRLDLTNVWTRFANKGVEAAAGANHGFYRKGSQDLANGVRWVSIHKYHKKHTALRMTIVSAFLTTRAARPALNAVPLTTPRCSLLARGNGVVPVA